MARSKFFSLALSLALFHGLADSPALAQEAKVDFEKQIWPILKAKCVDCHKAPFEENGRTRKPKAGLRMDGAWAIVAGSENGKVLNPGDGENSEIWWRTDLGPDDDDFMPPKGKADPLTAEEKEFFKKWIDEGASFGEWAGNLEGKPKEIAKADDKIPLSEIQKLYKKLSAGLDPLAEDAWKTVIAAGGRVESLAPGSPLLAVDFRLVREQADDAKVETVGAIGASVAHFDASKTSITDAALAGIGGMERLVRLDLHQTGITDAGLAHLKKLENLRYLNLYGTEVTDAGLKTLQGMNGLEEISLWQSKVTAKGVKQLQKALPEARISWK